MSQNGPGKTPRGQGFQGGIQQKKGQREDVDLRRFHPHAQDDLREAACIAGLDLPEHDNRVCAGHQAGNDIILDPELDPFDLLLVGVLVVEDDQDGGIEAKCEGPDDFLVDVLQSCEIRLRDIALQFGNQIFDVVVHSDIPVTSGIITPCCA